jgi:putative exporter of polyketide antibiotics
MESRQALAHTANNAILDSRLSNALVVLDALAIATAVVRALSVLACRTIEAKVALTHTSFGVTFSIRGAILEVEGRNWAVLALALVAEISRITLTNAT